MVKQGLLDKYGKKTDKTPADWRTNYTDYTEQKPAMKTESMDVDAPPQANGSPDSEKESGSSSSEEEEVAPKKKKVNAIKA